MSSMKYPYRDLGVPFDRNFRNDLNANFDDIEHDIRMIGGEAAQQALEAAEEANTQAIYAQTSGDYANDKGDYAAQQGDYAQTQGNFANEKGLYAQQQGDYAKAQGDYAKQVGDENKTRWLNPVATFADIATTYPNPQHGDTVMVTDDGENSGSVYRYENGQWNLTQKHNDLAIADVQNKIGILNNQFNGLKTKSSLKIVAHRGLSQLAPENTIPAYELAGKSGVKYFECDANVTSDGVVVLLHDDTVDRTTSGTGSLATISYATLQTFTVDAGSNIANYPNLKVPTLEAFLDVCRKYNATPVIDIKSNQISNIIDVIRKNGYEFSCHVICSSNNLEQTRALSPYLSIWYWVTTITDDEIARGKANNVSALACPKSQITKEIVQKCHSNGLGVAIDTIYNYNEIQTYASMGVDFLTCECAAIGGILNV